MWVCRLPVHIDPAGRTVLYENLRQIRYFSTGRQSRRPLQQALALPVGVDDSVRPQKEAVIQRASANSDAPVHSFVGVDAHIDPADRTVFTRICGEFVTSQWADRVVGPYRARRRFAAAHRAEQSPAPTKAWVNSYCFADFERRAFLPQTFKGNFYQIGSTVTGGAYLSSCKVSLCVCNG